MALLGIALAGGGLWLKMHLKGQAGPVWWWPGIAAAAFAVVACFAHAFIASLIGGRAAAAALKVIAFLVLAAMLVALWWSLQPKDGAH